jgi:tripartite-type tricarboxylate transporter receptor subunit TctC
MRPAARPTTWRAAVAEELGKRLGQSGGGREPGRCLGRAGRPAGAARGPDGYTLLFGTTSDMVVTPIANRAAGYAPRDFTPIGKVGVTPMTLVARPAWV